MALGSRSTAAAAAAAAGWLVATRTDPLLRQEVEGGHRLGSFSYHTGPSELITDEQAQQRTGHVRESG